MSAGLAAIDAVFDNGAADALAADVVVWLREASCAMTVAAACVDARGVVAGCAAFPAAGLCWEASGALATAVCAAGFALGDAVFEAANVVALLREASAAVTAPAAVCVAGFPLAVVSDVVVVALLRDVSGVLALAAAVCITGFAVVDAMPFDAVFDAAALPREASAGVATPATVCVAGFDDVEPFSGFEFAAVCVAGDATAPGAL